MSLHNKPNYQIPELIEALKAHRLPHDKPSQLADSFRIGWMACRELAQADSVHEDAALPDECEMLKHALWLASSFTVHRYLMSNAEGRWSGAEKATCHDELCCLYVAVFRGVEVDRVRVDLEADWMAVHDATQELTDHMDAAIGFPLKGVPDYEALAPKFFAYFHRLATHTLRASHGQSLESKIEGLTAAQESLGVEFERVLHDNLFDLYEESPQTASHGQAPATAQSADSVPAVSDLPPLPAPDLRDVGTKPQEIKEFLKGYATEYARTAIAARAPADSVLEDAMRYRWLREGNDAKHGAAWHVAVNLYGCEWDAAIDAARKQGATQ